MKYLLCPRCRARFHTGLIYESLEACSRCGSPLAPRRWRLHGQLREFLKRSTVRDSLDWEAITGSQYIRRQVIAKGRGQGGNPAPPA
jgi:hypothetical protein